MNKELGMTWCQLSPRQMASIPASAFSSSVTPLMVRTFTPVVSCMGFMPKKKVPFVVSACGIYAVVPKMTHFSNAQMPTKVFDGMAMAKPVIASKVSDLPSYWENPGFSLSRAMWTGSPVPPFDWPRTRSCEGSWGVCPGKGSSELVHGKDGGEARTCH